MSVLSLTPFYSSWRWFHALGRLLRRDDGTPLSYVGMFVDITDKKTAGL